jgi:hypothetical protein
MAYQRGQVQQAPGPQQISASELIDKLGQFEGPPEQFLVNLLAVQCHLGPASSGAIMRPQERQVEVLATYPPLESESEPPAWLSQAVESCAGVLSEGVPTVRSLRDAHDLYGAPARRHMVMLPLVGGGSVRGVEAFLVDSPDAQLVADCRDRLELTTSLLSLYEMRLTLQRRQGDMRRLRIAMETLSAVNEHDRFGGSAMALCNELASRCESDRVSLGFVKGRYVHIKAMSHTEKFSRKMKLVQDIEAAMEECLDQDLEVVTPSSEQATFVNRAATELAKRHGPTTVLSLPLRRGGEAVGVLTLERPTDKPFSIEEVEALRLTCDLVTARLTNLHEHDRWFGARMAAATRKGLAAAVGPKHTWIKAAALLIVGLILFAVFAKGEYQADAQFALEPVEQRMVAASFDSKLEEILVKPGEYVQAGQTLAILDTRDVEKELKDAADELRAAHAAFSDAMSAGDRSEQKRYEIQMELAEAKLEYWQRKIAEARLTAPIDGRVTSPDISQYREKAVNRGEALFVIAQDELEAELFIPEDKIVDVEAGYRGELATPGYPDRKVAFEIYHIAPRSEVKDGENVFRAKARLLASKPWLRPGLEGQARVDVREESYAVMWTRPLINWVRMKLWW